MNDKSNSANGVHSYDSTSTGQLISFFNRNVSEYPTEQGVRFDLVPVSEQKDLMINAARLHAQQEYNRIMELVSVLQKQADEIKKRLDLTDMVRSAKYDFKLYPGNKYWLVNDNKDRLTRLTILGPNDWNTGPPLNYDYICQIQWLGDYTWIKVENNAQ